MNKEELYIIIEDLLQDCYNDLFEYAEEELDEKKAKLIYDNVELFALKLKDEIEEK